MSEDANLKANLSLAEEFDFLYNEKFEILKLYYKNKTLAITKEFLVDILLSNSIIAQKIKEI